MQALTGAPRDHLTADQVRAIVHGNVTVDVGADLLDSDGVFTEDITDDLVPDGEVVQNGFDTVHRKCRLVLSRELDWGAVRLRPWMILTSKTSGLTLKAYLGVFLLDTPSTVSGENPRSWTVIGADLLSGLNTDVGRTYQVVAGTSVTDAVTQAVTDSGLSATVSLAESGTSPTLPGDMVWSMRDDVTWLRIVNDLLDAGGYRAVRADAEGRLRSEPYQPPSDRGSEWTYSTAVADTIVGPSLEFTSDLWQIPTRWVFYVDDPDRGEPVEGTTQYTVDTPSSEPTSEASRGRRITRKVPLEAADYASLVAQGDRISADERRSTRKASFTAGPNPLHGHFDIVTLVDNDTGLSGKWQVSSWRLPLDGSDMTLDVKAVS